MIPPPLPCDIPNRTAGVDVSEYQPIDTPWDAVAASGAVFVQIRVSSGIDYADSRAAEHARRANEAGLLVDFYHFLHSNENAKLQAEWCARRIEKMPVRHGRRVWIDWEDFVRMKLVGPARSLAACLAFGDRLDELVPGEAVIYTGPSVMAYIATAGVDLSALAQRSLVVAHYRYDQGNGHDYWLEAPTIPKPWTDAAVWQWGGNLCPRIPGVPFDLDRDVFFGPSDEYLRWAKNQPVRENPPVEPDTAQPLGRQDRAERDAAETAEASETEEPKTDPDAR